MGINNIIVNNYRKPYGLDESEHGQYELFIRLKLQEIAQSADIRTIEFFRMEKESVYDLRAGAKNRRLVIFNDAHFGGSTGIKKNEEKLKVDGIETRFETGFAPESDKIDFKSDNDIVYAQYDVEREEVVVLFDIFDVFDEDSKAVVIHLFKKLEELVFYPKTLRHSWIKTNDKDALVQTFKSRIQQQLENDVRNDRARFEQIQHNMEQLKRELRHSVKEYDRLMRTLSLNEQNHAEVTTKFIKEVDNVAELPKVTDLHVKDDYFYVYTDDIYAYDNGAGRRYYIGKFKIKINMERTTVRFYNLNNKRRSYWSAEDDHPHVNGNENNACLGNVDATIAELCARNEIYALVLICIDFLENANIDDPAGANIVNWDEVDEEGNIISKAETMIRCTECETLYTEPETVTAYETIVDGELVDAHPVCENCADENYEVSDGEYVRA